MNDILKAGGPSGVSRGETAVVAYGVASTAIIPVVLVVNASNASISTVPLATLRSLVEPFALLEPLIHFVSQTPADQWRSSTGRSWCATKSLALSEGIRFALLNIGRQHPEGKRLLEESDKLLFRALTGPLWALGPLITKDIGGEPKRARDLLFKWVSGWENVSEMLKGPHNDYSQALTVLGRVLDAITAAAADGDQEEREKAWKCASEHAIPLILSVSESQNSMNEFCQAFGINSSNTAAMQTLLDSVAALRAVSAAPDAPADFALAVSRIGLLLCVRFGYGLYVPDPDKPPRDPGTTADIFSSRPLMQCIQMAASCWNDVVRRSGGSLFQKNWLELHSVTLSAALFFYGCVYFGNDVVKFCASKGTPEYLSAASELASLLVASPASVVRALATVAASLPAALTLTASTPVSLNRLKAAREMAAGLQVPATIFSRAANFLCFAVKEGEPPIGDAYLYLDIAEAAHACLKTALALQSAGPGVWQPTGEAMVIFVEAHADPQSVVMEWFVCAMALNASLNRLSDHEEAGALVTLHMLAALAASSESQLQHISSFPGVFEVACRLLGVYSEQLTPILTPSDVHGLEVMLKYGSRDTDEITFVHQLMKVAKSAEGMEERQRRRLNMLGRLPPGVCANLRCSESLPGRDRLQFCSRCKVVRFCSLKCVKYAWKHGHKAPCQAVQHERAG